MNPLQPVPVKFFVGALFSDPELLTQAIQKLEPIFGNCDLVSKRFNFDQTDYYCAEMGRPIFRQFFGFKNLLPSELLPQAKLTTNYIENLLKIADHRKVNLDVGYLDYDKVTLASAKYSCHKIHLSGGIYADPTLHYAKGQFKPYPWAFLDFQTEAYTAFFLELRAIYKKQLREWRQIFRLENSPK
jgi:hypothetical protein